MPTEKNIAEAIDEAAEASNACISYYTGTRLSQETLDKIRSLIREDSSLEISDNYRKTERDYAAYVESEADSG